MNTNQTDIKVILERTSNKNRTEDKKRYSDDSGLSKNFFMKQIERLISNTDKAYTFIIRIQSTNKKLRK
jgi:hypothetical protein